MSRLANLLAGLDCVVVDVAVLLTGVVDVAVLSGGVGVVLVAVGGVVYVLRCSCSWTCG